MGRKLRYFWSEWHHEFSDEPIALLFSVDEQRMELEKYEVFRDGSYGYSGFGAAVGGTFAATLPYPDLQEINEDPQFSCVEISAEEFSERADEIVANRPVRLSR